MTSTLGSMHNLPAPAKLNLFLHVTDRRSDGMHLLESVFVLIDLQDSIDIELLDNKRIERTGDVIGQVDQDLCVRAARLLQSVSHTHLGARIRVRKRIPSGAGLGGGSSDCATTLIALNRLWNLNYSRKKLMELGNRLGADVPFFIFGQSAFAEGTGDKLSQFQVPASHWAVIMPGQPTPTGKIFQSKDLTRDTKSTTIAVLSDRIRSDWPEIPGHNDLEPVAKALNPEIQVALNHLGPKARMTGSGSAVFVWCSSKEDALKQISHVPAGMQGYAVESLGIHPLREYTKDF